MGQKKKDRTVLWKRGLTKTYFTVIHNQAQQLNRFNALIRQGIIKKAKDADLRIQV